MIPQPHFRRSLIAGGLLLLLVPPVGWVIALGYRSLLLNMLIDGEDVSELKLPEQSFRCFANGLKAVGVIYAYYLPFLVSFILLGVPTSELAAHGREIASFFCLIPLFLPICMLGVPAYYLKNYSWISLDPAQFLLLAIIFAIVTFLMPAAFMQVGLRGNYRAAFNLRRVVAGLLSVLPSYLLAWLYSAIVLTLTVLALPIFPWITFWAYLVFGFLFLHCAYLTRSDAAAQRFRNMRELFEAKV